MKMLNQYFGYTEINKTLIKINFTCLVLNEATRIVPITHVALIFLMDSAESGLFVGLGVGLLC